MCQAAQQLSQDDLVLLLTAKKKKEQAVEDKKADKEGQVTLEAGLCLCSAYSPPGHTQRSTFHLSIAPFFVADCRVQSTVGAVVLLHRRPAVAPAKSGLYPYVFFFYGLQTILRSCLGRPVNR